MTKPQVELLKRLIAADRAYHSRKAAGDPWVSVNDRGIEVAWGGWDMRTATALVDAGLAECLDPGINGRTFIFLGKYNPYDEQGDL